MKPNVTPNMFTKMLANNADKCLADTGEGDLVLAVVNQTVADAVQSYKYRGRRPFQPKAIEACRAFFDGRIDAWVRLIGLDPVFVREQVTKTYPWMVA